MVLNLTRTKRDEAITDPYSAKTLEPISVVPIPQIADDVAYGRLVAQHSVLNRAIEQRRQLLERCAIGDELQANSSLGSGERKQRLRERLGRLDS
jgi:hypothetical protein